MKYIYLIVIILLLITCNSEPENPKPFQYKSLSDTTSVFDRTKIDSSELDNYKSFIHNKSDEIVDRKMSVNQIDSMFDERISEVKLYNKVQNNVEVTFVIGDHEYGNTKRYFIKLSNNSGQIIDAMKVQLDYYNSYKESVGYQIIDLKKRILKDSVHIQKFLPVYNSKSLLMLHNDLYVASSLIKLAISDGTSLESKIEGNVYNFENFQFPYYLNIERSLGRHMLTRLNQ
ncbi:MAG: hypothetical protein JXR20_04650 [Balneola sp.]